ncbi:hypothetical protein B0H14DRAFT_3442789 [Mycena olivaceomarginata]|nr:hypothetical protein B0H14DRAFT_3442789 [Mycena olivaceomarginata]
MRATYGTLLSTNEQDGMSPPMRETVNETGVDARDLCAAAVDERAGQNVPVDAGDRKRDRTTDCVRAVRGPRRCGGRKRGRHRCVRPTAFEQYEIPAMSRRAVNETGADACGQLRSSSTRSPPMRRTVNEAGADARDQLRSSSTRSPPMRKTLNETAANGRPIRSSWRLTSSARSPPMRETLKEAVIKARPPPARPYDVTDARRIAALSTPMFPAAPLSTPQTDVAEHQPATTAPIARTTLPLLKFFGVYTPFQYGQRPVNLHRLRSPLLPALVHHSSQHFSSSRSTLTVFLLLL